MISDNTRGCGDPLADTRGGGARVICGDPHADDVVVGGGGAGARLMGSLAATAEEKAAALAAVADEKEALWSRSLKREGVPDFFRLCNGAGRCCNNTGALADNGSIGAGLDGGERDAIRGVGEDAPTRVKCNRPDFWAGATQLFKLILIYEQTRHLSSHHHLDCVQ